MKNWKYERGGAKWRCLKRFIKGQTVKRGSKLIQSIFHKTRKIMHARIALMMKVIWIWMKKFKVAWSEEVIWRNLTVAKACKCWCLAKRLCIWYTLLSYREPLPCYWPFYSLICYGELCPSWLVMVGEKVAAMVDLHSWSLVGSMAGRPSLTGPTSIIHNEKKPLHLNSSASLVKRGASASAL